jgi:molecular chaperone GrpE (heat shock protein)
MLSVHEINDVVDRVREWLVESNEELDNADILELAHILESKEQLASDSGTAEVGLVQIAEAFTSLRHEIKLHTKSVRTLQDQVGEGLNCLGEATATLNTTTVETQQRAERAMKPLIEALLDLDEALVRASTMYARNVDQADRSADSLMNECQTAFDQLPAWKRVAARFWQEEMMQTVKRWQAKSRHDNSDDYQAGLRMLQTRLERAFAASQIQRMACVGQTVDPQTMRVVEAVRNANSPLGTVLEEVRPGYLREGKVLRHAEVKAAAE